ncbi:AraC family transcriptional regulator [Aeromicrobium sp. Root236]|uniref:helix-turn-helix domain-containing protein n=1 Tax=Aeromicrobium sp. Root236 TaxID=1736498 RepID=UPI0006F4E578|nr:helix-turn-helix domain-containing protein [Aeromicrobium sp. Root236]KRC66377.1 AraC family transcriptional regulator [Aeromicrobium sp. Root236]
MTSEPAGRGDSAIVRPTAAAQHIDIRRVVPAERWQPFIQYHWIVRWECPEPFDQQVIPQPFVHVSAEPFDGAPRLLVNGITREPFVRTLTGTGHVLGAAFKPASFRAVLGADLSTVSGLTVPIGDQVSHDDSPAAAEILGSDVTDEGMVAALEAYLDRLDVTADPYADELNALVDRAEHDRSLIRAEQLADLAGVSLRTLQRQFTAYLGIGPKWVVQRFRMLDAAAAAHAGTRTDWAALATELGFSDQAHLTRAFTAVVGTPPATYAKQA